MKKILFIGDLRSIHLQKYVKWFQKKYEVFCMTDYKVEEFNFDKNKVKIYYEPQKLKLPIIRHLIQIYKLKKIIKKERPDIINAQFLTEDGWYAAFSGFRPVILTIWGSDIYITPKSSKFYKFLGILTLKKVDKIIVVSMDQKEEVLKYVRNISEKIEVLQYGIDLKVYSKIDKRVITKLQKDFSTSKKDFVIVSPRRLFPIYNIDIIINMFFEFSKKIENSKLIIVGDGDDEEKLKQLVKNLKLEDKVKFAGRVLPDNMKYYYALSDVVISIPNSDGMPLTVLEAMAIGKPVIVTDLPSLREIIKNKKNGFLIKPKSSILLESVLKLYNDKQLLIRMGRINKEFVRKNFDYKKQMKKIENLFINTLI